MSSQATNKQKGFATTFASLAENLPDIIYSFDPYGVFLQVNQAVEPILGYTPQEIIGTSVLDLVHDDDADRMRQALERDRNSKDREVRAIEFRMVSKSGQIKYFEVRRKLAFENGEMVQNDGIARDVSRRKQLEEELKTYSIELENRVRERTERLESANRQLAALNGVSNKFSLIYDENELYDAVPHLLTHSLDFDRALFLLDDNGRLQVRSYCFDWDAPELVERFIGNIKSGSYKFPEPLLESFREQKTILIRDPKNDPRWPVTPDDAHTKAIVMTPVKWKNTPIGMIIGNKQHHEQELDDQDVARFEMFANMVGLAVDNIRSYQSLERKVVERTNSLREANKKLQEQTQQLKENAYALGRANVQLLAAQEELVDKNLEKERLLAELSKSKDELLAIVDSSLSAIVMVNQDDQVVEANRRIAEIWGIAPDKIINAPFHEFGEKIRSFTENPEQFDKIIASLRESEKTLSADEIDNEFIFAHTVKVLQPHSKFVSIFTMPVKGRDGKTLGRIWVYTDVTKVKQADEQLRAIVEISPIPYSITRVADGEILFANEQLAKLVGMPVKELIGSKAGRFYTDPEDRERVIEKIRKHGRVYNEELRMRKADGTEIWALLSFEATELDGEPVLIGASYDIDARKRAEQQLAESEQRFRQLTETIDQIFWMRDAATGELIYVNPAFETIYGRPLDSHYLQPNAILEQTYPDDRERLHEVLARMPKEEVTIEFRITHGKDGSLRWLRARTFPIRNEAGEIYRIGGLTEDITDRKEAINALIESEQRFRNLVENANDIIFTLTPDYTISYVSPNCAEILGYSAEEFAGQKNRPFIHEEDFPTLSAFYREILETGQKKSGPEYRVRHKDGKWRWYVSNAAPLKDAHGEVVGIVGIGHDITALKGALDALGRANQELRDTQSQLVQSEKMASLGNLVAGIAHEINTPVGSISSMHSTLIRAIDVLQERMQSICKPETLDDRRLQATLKVIGDANRVIKSGSERVTNIVKRLRSFARLDEAELKTIDIHEGIEDTLLLIHHEIKHRITINRRFGKVPPVACYPGQLNQVFLNILINASQAIKEKGEITIATSVKDDYVQISIRDTGVGIPAANLKKIFDPGFTTKGVGVGTGLGLSICYQIIHQTHRGEIKVESEVGKGTTFTVFLPMDLDRQLEAEGVMT